jgi:IS30 family transposase
MPRSFRHLVLSERIFIETQLSLGMRAAGIAAALKRAPSTISREIRRNRWRANLRKGSRAGGYRCETADRRARVLAGKARRRRKLKPGNQLWKIMLKHLRQGLSPKQIARTLARMADPVRLSHEAIYTALYAMPRGQLRASLLDLLRRRHKARRPARGKSSRSRSIADMTLIDQRPVEVEMRLVPGHWEGDLIIGKGNLSQVGTLVERKSLFVALVKLPNGKADTVAKSFTTIFRRFESQMRLSMTVDQGSEMSKHKTLTQNTGVTVYFAHPHAPWERGICENINGLLRQYLPKSTDLSLFSQDQLDQIAWKLNTRPRETLGWKAPAELFLPEGAFDFVKYWSNIGKGAVPTSPRRAIEKRKANHASRFPTAPATGVL